MKIDAKLLQDSLAFLGLGVSKIISDRPISKMLELCTENGFLVGTTCDGINNIRLKICATTETLNALIEYELFNNIIKSCTGEIELIEQNNNVIQVKSSSMKCKVLSSYYRNNTSMPHTKMENCVHDIDFTNLSEILPISKSIIDPNFSIDCYRHIYFGDNIMVTDTNNVAIINKKFFNTPVLLSYKTIEILSKLNKAKYIITNEIHSSTNREYKKLYVKTDSIEFVCLSKFMQLFQYDDLNDLFSMTATDSITLNKEVLNKAYNTAKLFKNSKVLFIFDTNNVSLRVDQSDFTYIISDVGISTKHIFKATDDLMKKILTLSDKITISIFDNMIKCSSKDIEEIFSVEEIT